MPNLRFAPQQLITRLPKAYYEGNLDLDVAPDVWNFEVDGIELHGEYELGLEFADWIAEAEISLDREGFLPLVVERSTAKTRVTIDHAMLSFDIRISGGHTDECPLLDIYVVDDSIPQRPCRKYDARERDTCLDQCNLRDNWPVIRQQIIAEDFDLCELIIMRDEIVDWSATRQVLDLNDPHYGAIYSEEDKYSFTDAIFAACCFMKRFKRTRDSEWLRRAEIARDYAFKGQYVNTGEPGKDGAWSSMGIIDDPSGKKYRRITQPWSLASGVDTGIIVTQAERLHAMGMGFDDHQLDQLRGAISWQMQNRIRPGWFSHHENMDKTCVNVNSIVASQVFATHRILTELTGSGVRNDVLDEAVRAYRHVLACQKTIGVYPYRLSLENTTRGGAYRLHNTPDNGMGLFHQMHLIRNPYSPFNFHALRSPMRRSALWYLLTSRIHEDKLVLDFDTSEHYTRGLAFGNFTWCRITMMDVISQLWDSIGDREFWMQFVRGHLRTIRETLWNHHDPDHAPIIASVTPLKIVSWIQQAEWAAMVFDNLAFRYGIAEPEKEMEGNSDE